MSAPHAIGLAILAITWLGCAVALTAARVRWCAAALAAGAAVIGGWLVMRGQPAGGGVPVVLIGMLFGPLSIVAYPRPTARSVDGPAMVLVPAVTAAALATGGLGHGYLPALTLAVVVVHLWWRFEHLDARGRQPLVWLVIGLGACGVLMFVTAFVLPQAPQLEALAIASCGLPAVCMVIGVRRPDLVEAAGIVGEAAVLGVTALVCLCLYVTGASLLSVVAGRPPGVGVQAVVAVGAAAAFGPVRERVHGAVGELLFGRRRDPIAAAAHAIGAVHLDTEGVLERVRRAFVVPYAAVRPGPAGTRAPATGARVRSFPLHPGSGQDAPALVVGLRPGELRFSPADAQALALVARLLGQLQRAESLTARLTRSRAATHAAVEEERRRLRRDLHDGLGPALTGIAFTADAVGNLLGPRQSPARDLLLRLRDEAAGAIADVRRIVEDIRPPALDQLGLQGALAQVSMGLHRPGLAIDVEVAEAVGELPAAHEVTVYRIVAEALTNAARHTSSTHVVAELTREHGELRVRVRDDGRAGEQPWRAGIGLTSMRERTEELGGTLRTGPTACGGLVEARLPLA